MKSSLLLAGFAATLSLASCSSNTTTETTPAATTPAGQPAATTATTTTTRTYTDADYHTRGDRMAMRFASANKISDEATMNKLKMAYYNRAKRYDEMMAKYKADTTGMGQGRRDYMKANDQEFQTALSDKTQYQSYQSSSSTPDYDESSNMDIQNQTDAASSATMPANSGSTTTMSEETSSTTTTGGSDMGSGAMVEKGKTKMTDGSKVKVKDDGTVKMKDADGNKTKM